VEKFTCKGKEKRMMIFRKVPIAVFPGAFILLVVLLFLVVATPQKSQGEKQLPIASSNVVIDYTSPIRKLDPLAMGMDISGYGLPNVFAVDQVEQQKLKMLGIKYMRMDLKYSIPGDPTSKIICAGDGCDTQWEGAQWIQAIKSIGAQPLVIVPYNYTDAANIVKYFNKDTNNYVRYWIIGNEQDRSGISATAYSTSFNQEYDAMKAIDSTIQIGGAATAWYDSPFLQTFLQQSGSRVDFVDFHGYAQEGNVPGDYATLFQLAAAYENDINKLRSLIEQIVPDRASHIGIEVGEWELNWGGTEQNNTNFHAVWAASVMGHILRTGGRSLFYADKGNAIYGSPHTITDSAGHVVNIQVDDTNPAYHGIGMFTGEGLFRGFGDTLVDAGTSLPNVEVYASDHPKNIVVINKDPSITRNITVSLKGITSGTVDVWRKDEAVLFPDPPLKRGTLPVLNGTFTYQLPPFSITTFLINTASQTS
jgi:Alpha-L-arabinofuranosidase